MTGSISNNICIKSIWKSHVHWGRKSLLSVTCCESEVTPHGHVTKTGHNDQRTCGIEHRRNRWDVRDDPERNAAKRKQKMRTTRSCDAVGYCQWPMFFEELKTKEEKAQHSSTGNRIYIDYKLDFSNWHHTAEYLLWANQPRQTQVLWLQKLGKTSVSATKSAEKYYLVLWRLLLLLLH